MSSATTPQFYLNENNEQQLRGVPFPGAPVNPATDQNLKFWFVVDETTTINFDEQGNRNDDTDVLVLDMETTASAMVAN